MSIVSNVSAAVPSITLLDSIQNIKRGREKSNWNCFAFSSRASNQIATRPGEQFFLCMCVVINLVATIAEMLLRDVTRMVVHFFVGEREI